MLCAHHKPTCAQCCECTESAVHSVLDTVMLWMSLNLLPSHFHQTCLFFDIHHVLGDCLTRAG
eukprot:m.78107 g.78107  ORF g.78107 m.78107 type:complete len:63 (-) comp12518_c0_seq1:20-208(-)